ncbi:MAG: hydrogenase maturation protease [Acidobacteria bacterium]|nr:hydrogenase maturation protease [Acidobacteriota bacterium]
MVFPEGFPRVGLVGIGNTLAGDDGAGVVAVSLLREACGEDPRLFFHFLDGDLFALSEVLGRAPRFLVVDAVLGDPPGRIVRRAPTPTRLAPSFHQADALQVVATLRELALVDPFPEVELWGVTIRPPRDLSESLSPPVEAAVRRLARRLKARLDDLLNRGEEVRDTGR